MKIIAVVNRRGGAGKTATVNALGAGLKLKGKNVLYIDLDSQTNLSYELNAAQTDLSSMNLLTQNIPAEKIIQSTAQGDLIPADTKLSFIDLILTETGKEYKLKEALQPLQKKYDYIILDTPPALGIITTNALTAADMVIIPAQAEIHSLQGIGLIYDTIETIKKYTNHKLKIAGILITRFNSRSIISKDMKENLKGIAKQIKTKVYETPIRECVSVKEAQAIKQDIFKYAPKSNAAKDYSDFIEEFLKDN